jgi:hypothetical protein
MLVDEWIEQYKSHKESALLSLMQFFINGSGCRGKITSNMANNMEHAAIIRKMTEEFDEVSRLKKREILGIESRFPESKVNVMKGHGT